MFNIPNHVRTAVDRLGGPTKTAHAASVSNATVHKWLNAGRIPNIDKALIIAATSNVDVQLLRGTR
ncbi:carph-isopro domain-containing protein [Paraburkholderia dipogonis]|uniref:carph-isopro domain-containing protein n=1 Tax=Paraburkholderia dipogonis TaxID=1211383 RepID=UPI0035EE05F7